LHLFLKEVANESARGGHKMSENPLNSPEMDRNTGKDAPEAAKLTEKDTQMSTENSQPSGVKGWAGNSSVEELANLNGGKFESDVGPLLGEEAPGTHYAPAQAYANPSTLPDATLNKFVEGVVSESTPPGDGPTSDRS
jgi:hypothetical protein